MYKIVTDGSCDLSVERVKELEIKVVPFYVSIDGVNHQKEIVDLNIRDFYQFMIDNPKVFPKTSMPSIQDYLDVFTPLLKAGNDIICICITTKFSGSFNSAINAKNILLAPFLLQNLLFTIILDTSNNKNSNFNFDITNYHLSF